MSKDYLANMFKELEDTPEYPPLEIPSSFHIEVPPSPESDNTFTSSTDDELLFANALIETMEPLTRADPEATQPYVGGSTYTQPTQVNVAYIYTQPTQVNVANNYVYTRPTQVNDAINWSANLDEATQPYMFTTQTLLPGNHQQLSSVTSEPPAKRFKFVEEEDLKNLQENFHQSKATKQNTKWGVKLFQEWHLETHGYLMSFDEITKSELNEKLRHFYLGARPKNPEKRATSMSKEHANIYHKNTLKNIRAALNRHLKDIGQDYDIVKDKEFKPSNVILDSTLKMMVSSGLSRPTKHKQIISPHDLEAISAYLFVDFEDPIRLRLKVWYVLAIHFVSRGLEFHHQLNLNSFDYHHDADGDEFVTINHETRQKTVQGGIISEEASTDKAMYAADDSTNPIYCPVRALKKLIAKTDPNASSLFNRMAKDIDVNTHTIWYTRQALAKRTYSGFMAELCQNAKCSSTYTAHCLRATAISCMSDDGHELRHIMYMSGHRNEASIRSYNRGCSVPQKKALSNTLSRMATGKAQKPTATAINLKPTLEIVPSATAYEGPATANARDLCLSQSSSRNTSVLNNAGILNNSMFTGCTFHLSLPDVHKP